MPEEREKSEETWNMREINWIGLATGILMLILPFMGVWWKVVVGTGAFKIAISPFKYEILLAGETLTSPLVSYFIIAAKLTLLGGGSLMIVGSLAGRRWWGRKLVGWGAMKATWMLIFLIAALSIGTLLMNKFLPSFLTGMFEEGGSAQLELPYLIGTGHASIQPQEGVTISGPITASLTPSFWMAVVTAGMGVGTKIYQNKILEKEEEPGEETEKGAEGKKDRGEEKAQK